MPESSDQSLPAENAPVAPLGYAMPPGADSADRVSRGDIAVLILRIIGIYIFLLALPNGWGMAGALMSGTFHGLALAYGATAAVFAAMGIAVFLNSRRLAFLLLPRESVVEPVSTGNAAAQMQAVAFSVVGVLLICWSAPMIAWAMAYLMTPPSSGSGVFRAGFGGALPTLVQYLVELALGIWLFFGSSRLAAWWWRMRHPEFRPVEPVVDQEAPAE